MYYFRNDYSETAHPDILAAISETNYVKDMPYGLDNFCYQAANLIKGFLDNDKADVHFLVGGTQTNLTAISSFLRPHEAVIAADTSHIAVHETGAIEATGHKIITVQNTDGKITYEQIKKVLQSHKDEHMVKPKLVKISNATEYGTVYNKDELTKISAFCKENDLLLYLDGARLGAALAASKETLSLKDVSSLTDAFYIGGTKNGALFGEALVICNNELKKDFRYLMKQRGAVLAKGKILGIQFIELFKNGLYFELAENAIKMADKIRHALTSAGYSFYTETKTNQIFPVLPNELIEKLSKDFSFEVWDEIDDNNTIVRFVTSWATDTKSVNALARAITQKS